MVDVALSAPVLQVPSLHGTLPSQGMLELVVVVSLVVEKVGLAVALAGTATSPASSVQELLTAGSSQAVPLPGLGQVFGRPAPLLLVSAVVARAVGQGLQSGGG